MQGLVGCGEDLSCHLERDGSPRRLCAEAGRALTQVLRGSLWPPLDLSGLLEDTLVSRHKSRERREDVTAALTGGNGSCTKMVAVEVGRDFAGGVDSIC